jgi:hypothetical protein
MTPGKAFNFFYWETLLIGLTVAEIGTGLMNGSDSEPFWERGISSQPPFIERENGCL